MTTTSHFPSLPAKTPSRTGSTSGPTSGQVLVRWFQMQLTVAITSKLKRARFALTRARGECAYLLRLSMSSSPRAYGLRHHVLLGQIFTETNELLSHPYSPDLDRPRPKSNSFETSIVTNAVPIAFRRKHSCHPTFPRTAPSLFSVITWSPFSEQVETRRGRG